MEVNEIAVEVPHSRSHPPSVPKLKMTSEKREIKLVISTDLLFGSLN